MERERQKRIETERARLKRQFVLSNGGATEEHLETAKEDGSVVGTVGGGSSVAAAAADVEDEKQSEKLGYAMERFLSESGQVVVNGGDLKPKPHTETAGVVMERFLSEPVVVSSIVADEPEILDEPMSDLHMSDIPSDLPMALLHHAPASVTFDDENIVHSHPEDLLRVDHSNFEGAEDVHHLRANSSMEANSQSAVDVGTLSDLDRFSDHGINLLDRKSTRLNSSHLDLSRMPSSA